METGEDASGPAGDTPAVHAPRRGLWSALIRLAVLGGFFAAAALGSWQLRNQSDSAEEDSGAAPVEIKTLPNESALTGGNPVELLARADQALRQHRFAMALSMFEELRASSPDHGPLIGYRYALCHESIGQFDKAIGAYRTAISGSSSPALSFVCHLGLARCLFRQGQFADARRVLYPFLFDESRQRDLPRTFAADARYLVALALSREAMAPKVEKTAGEGPISVSTIGLEIPYYLDELGSEKGKVGEAEKGKAEGEKGQKVGGEAAKKEQPAKAPSFPPAPVVVKKRADSQAVVLHKVDVDRLAVDVLDLLSNQTGISIKVSANAGKVLDERFLRLLLQNWPLDDLLEPIADYFGLAFRVEGTTRLISTTAEIEAKQLAALQRDRGIRALRGALLTDSGHPWTAAACLELGNWEAAQGRLPEAATWFERLVRESPHSPFVPAAYFNLALVQLDKQDAVAARIAFFRVVDHSPGHDLALKAYLRIGMSHLEEDEFKEGIVHLRHAQATAPHSPQHAEATTALAAAYVLDKQPEAARTTLAKERALLQKSPCKATAAFVDAYAQYHLAKESSPARREASDLLGTLWRDQDKTVLGPLGDLMIAQAYRELGFWSHAEQILRRTTPPARSTLARAIEYALADTLMKQQRREEATKLFEKLAGAPSNYRPQARLQLAQIKLLDKHFKECAELCKELWKERPYLDAQALLQTWGAALEGMGDFAGAAQCYAGTPPE